MKSVAGEHGPPVAPELVDEAPLAETAIVLVADEAPPTPVVDEAPPAPLVDEVVATDDEVLDEDVVAPTAVLTVNGPLVVEARPTPVVPFVVAPKPAALEEAAVVAPPLPGFTGSTPVAHAAMRAAPRQRSAPLHHLPKRPNCI